MYDGMAGIALLNMVEEDRIDVRTVNNAKLKRRQSLSLDGSLGDLAIKENIDLFLLGCQGLIKIQDVNSDDFMQRNAPKMIDVIGQILKLIIVKNISFRNCPEIMCLVEEGEEPESLHNLLPEQILLRWVNYHLVKQKQQKIKNLEKDLDNCLVYLHLLHSIDPETCSTEGLQE